MKTNALPVYEFLQSCAGNWRNCLAIRCHSCPYGKSDPCQGFLFTANADGNPIVLRADYLAKELGQPVDTEECIATLDRHAFEAAFSHWLLWRVDNPKCCALQQLSP